MALHVVHDKCTSESGKRTSPFFSATRFTLQATAVLLHRTHQNYLMIQLLTAFRQDHCRRGLVTAFKKQRQKEAEVGAVLQPGMCVCVWGGGGRCWPARQNTGNSRTPSRVLEVLSLFLLTHAAVCVQANRTVQTRSPTHSDLASSISACALNKSSAHTCTCNNAPLDTALIPLLSLSSLPLAPTPPPTASASAAPLEAAAAAAGEEASNSSRAR